MTEPRYGDYCGFCLRNPCRCIQNFNELPKGDIDELMKNFIQKPMRKIISISEAYSQQPVFELVNTEKFAQNNRLPNTVCVRIEEERVAVNTDKQCSFYIGYNLKGEMLFKYLADSVNVHYFND